MKELNIIITTTLLALLFRLGLEARAVSRETFIGADLLETTLPIDGTIDTEYLIRLEDPANVQ